MDGVFNSRLMNLEESAEIILSFGDKSHAREVEAILAGKSAGDVRRVVEEFNNSAEGKSVNELLRKLMSDREFCEIFIRKQNEHIAARQEKYSKLSPRQKSQILTVSSELAELAEKGDPVPAVEEDAADYPPVKAYRLSGTGTRKISKLGDSAGLPGHLTWPVNSKGGKMAFIGRIALSELEADQSALKLPPKGILYLFWDLEDSLGDGVFWKVIFSENEEVSADENDGLPVGFKPITSKWKTGNSGILHALSLLLGSHHQLGGYPEALPGYPDMRLQCVEQHGGNVGDWILLLQFSEDKKAELIWYENGRAFFWIKKSDLENSNFDQTVMIIQSF